MLYLSNIVLQKIFWLKKLIQDFVRKLLIFEYFFLSHSRFTVWLMFCGAWNTFSMKRNTLQKHVQHDEHQFYLQWFIFIDCKGKYRKEVSFENIYIRTVSKYLIANGSPSLNSNWKEFLTFCTKLLHTNIEVCFWNCINVQ